MAVKKYVEYLTERECTIIEGWAGAWCVIERKRTHDEVVEQYQTQQEAEQALAKGVQA